MADLIAAIENSVAEVTDVDTPETDTPPVEDAQPDPVEAAPEATPDPAAADATSQVASPAAKVEAKPAEAEDEFAKRHGISAQGAFGKENRIPYSRVKKITANAEKAVEDKWTAEKSKWDKELTDYKTKVTDFETKFKNVAEFEKVMVNDKLKFLQLLTNIPGYREIFERMAGGAPQRQAQPQAEAETEQDPRPGPDRELADGTRVYSDEGLDKLFQWNQRQAIRQAEALVSKKFAPMASEYERLSRERQVREYYEAQIPKVQKQIEDARKWPLFNENEAKIVEALAANQSLSLDGAYRQVVLPQLQDQATKQPSREEIRAELLKELQKAPVSTSASVAQTKPVVHKPGSRSMEAIIEEAIRPLKQAR